MSSQVGNTPTDPIPYAICTDLLYDFLSLLGYFGPSGPGEKLPDRPCLATLDPPVLGKSCLIDFLLVKLSWSHPPGICTPKVRAWYHGIDDLQNCIFYSHSRIRDKGQLSFVPIFSIQANLASRSDVHHCNVCPPPPVPNSNALGDLFLPLTSKVEGLIRRLVH